MDIRLDSIFALSDDIVAREIEGELIIVPLAAGIADLEDELFTLNETGRIIFSLIDGQKTLDEIIQALEQEFDAPVGAIKRDVLGLVQELARRRMLVEVEAV